MKKPLITIIILLVVIVGGYIVYDQLVTNDETGLADTKKETNIDDSDTDTDTDTVEDTVVETNGDADDAGDVFEREFVAKDVWGSVPAITVDANDAPHVAFYNREFGDLI